MSVPSRRTSAAARPVACTRCGRKVEGSTESPRASAEPLCGVCARMAGAPGSPLPRPLLASSAPAPAPVRPASPLPLAVPPGHTAIRCFQCGRRGHVPSRQLLAREASEILCPRCRSMRSVPAPSIGKPAPLRAAVVATTPVPNRIPLVGRPPMILARSKVEAGIAATAPLRGSRNFFAVKCFVCGRAGRLPVRPEIPLRLEDVICPTCRHSGAGDRPSGARPTPRVPTARSAPAP